MRFNDVQSKNNQIVMGLKLINFEIFGFSKKKGRSRDQLVKFWSRSRPTTYYRYGGNFALTIDSFLF